MWADIFHIFWPSDYIKWRVLLPIVKTLNPKLKIIFNTVGSDVTWRPALIQEYNRNNIKYTDAFATNKRDISFSKLKRNLKIVRIFEKYSTVYLASRLTSTLGLRPYFKNWLPLQLDEIEENQAKNSVPVIVHSTKDRIFKGTDLVIQVIEKLKKDNINFRFNLYEDIPRKELLKKLSECDIVIYNPIGTSPGKFGLEALASGCILLTGYKNNFELETVPDCPIVDVTPDNLYEKLKDVIINLKNYEHLKERGKNWVNNFEPKFLSKRILKHIDDIDNGIEKKLIKPEFFRNYYIPVYGKKELQLINYYNKYVSGCKWYNDNIEKGNRDGIIF